MKSPGCTLFVLFASLWCCHGNVNAKSTILSTKIKSNKNQTYEFVNTQYPQISQALNSDGTLKQGMDGNFDATGYSMVKGLSGNPVFVPLADPLGLNNGVHAIAVNGSNVYVGGEFTDAGGNVNADHIALWNGSTWNSLGSGLNDLVSCIVVSGSNVYVGGDFTNAGGNANADFIALWNGSSWSALGSGVNNQVLALAVTGSNVYVGGVFTDAGGNANADYIALWNGSSWSALGTGLNWMVMAIVISGADVYVGGFFTDAGGIPNADAIAIWRAGTWVAMGTGLNNLVHDIAISGSNVYVTGEFTDAGGNANADKIALWNGSSWNALGTGLDNGGYALALNGSHVYVGGGFNHAGGNFDAHNCAKWNGSNWSALGSGLNNSVYSFAITPSDIYVGGYFTDAFGMANSNYIAKQSLTPEPTAQPTALTFSPVGRDAITLNYTAASGSPTGYIIVRKEGSAPSSNPVDGMAYALGETLGDGEVVYIGNGVIHPDEGLIDDTDYFYKIFSYNGAGGSINYLTTAPLQGNQVTGGSMYYSRQNGDWQGANTWSLIGHNGPSSFDFPDAVGQQAFIGNGHTVSMSGPAGSSIPLSIANGSTLDANGFTLDTGGNFEIYGSVLDGGVLLNGFCSLQIKSPNSIPVFTELIIDDVCGSAEVTLETDIVLTNGVTIINGDFIPAGFIVYPCIPPSNSTVASSPQFTNLNGTSLTLSWTNPGSGADGVMVVARAGGTLVKPIPGTDYTANSVFGLGNQTVAGSLNYIVYKGTGNTVNLTGLTPNTDYVFDIYVYKGTNCYNIRTALEPTQNSGANPPPVLTFNPLNGATNVSVSGNITITASEAIRKLDNSAITSADLATLINLKLTNNTGAIVPFTATLNAANTIITINPTDNLLISRVYYVELKPVEDVDGIATLAQSITFTTQAGPSITNVAPLSVCLGQSVTVMGTNFGTATPVVTINGNSIPVSSHTATSITLIPTLTAGGTVTVTNTDLSLSTVSSTVLTIASIPNVLAVSGGGTYCVGGNGVTIGMANSQAGVEYEVYLATTATGVKATPGGGAFNFTGFFTTAGIYTVKGKTTGSCTSDMAGTAVVHVSDIPSGSGSISSPTTSVCQGSSIDLLAVGFTNALTYEWSLPSGLTTNSSGSAISVLATAGTGGIVSVAARNNCGPTSATTFSITVNPLPIVSIEAPPADKQIVDDVLSFTSTVDIPVTSYAWNFGDGNESTSQNATNTYSNEGAYTISLKVSTNEDCEGAAQKDIAIIDFPFLPATAIKNVVTANGDAKNDRLIISDIDRFPNNTVSVLDRWGVEVYNQNEYKNEWDFKKGGNYLPAGNYICIVKLKDSNTTISRAITLIRK